MSTVYVSPLLRRALQADASLSLFAAIAFTLGAGLLDDLLGLPTALLIPLGVGMLPWAAALYWLSRREVAPAVLVWGVIVINALWVVESAWVSLGGMFHPTALGHAFVAVQALAVLVLAELEFVGMRRSNLAMA